MAKFSLLWQSLWNTKQKRQLGLCTVVLGWHEDSGGIHCGGSSDGADVGVKAWGAPEL